VSFLPVLADWDKLRRSRETEEEMERRANTRKKILVGAAVLATVEQCPEWQEWLNIVLDRQLTQAADREFFGLPEIPGQDRLTTFCFQLDGAA
jgi:hypothetical protein